MSEDFNPEAQYEMQKAREDEHAWDELCEAISDGSAGHEDVRAYLASRDVCRPPEMVVHCIDILFDSIKALQTLHREQLVRAERAEMERDGLRTDIALLQMPASSREVECMRTELDDAKSDLAAARAEAARYRLVLNEWNEPGACGCDTATCMETCLPAMTRAALAGNGEGNG